MLNKGAFALEIVRGDPELTADCRVTLNRGDRIGSLDCSPFDELCKLPIGMSLEFTLIVLCKQN